MKIITTRNDITTPSIFTEISRVSLFLLLSVFAYNAYGGESGALFVCEVDVEGSKYQIRAEMANNQGTLAQAAKLSVNTVNQTPAEEIVSDNEVLVGRKEQYNYVYYTMKIEEIISFDIKQFVGEGLPPPITAYGTLQRKNFSGKCEVLSVNGRKIST